MALKKKATGRIVDKIATAKHRAKIAQGQVNSNMEKGSKVNIKDNYAAASTPAQRTKDLNKLNDLSKTAGRAKNLESKFPKRAVASGGKAFTPAQIAELKKMMRSAGRLDK